MRESTDDIELDGIQRTQKQLDRADLILHTFDATAPRPSGEDWTSGKMFSDRDYESGPVISYLNKCDLGEHETWKQDSVPSVLTGNPVRISCKTGAGMDELAAAIFHRAINRDGESGDAGIAINARHQDCLQKAERLCAAAREALSSNLSAEFIAVELRAALDAVGEIVGIADTEELLGRIFSTFCIGK